MKITCDNVQPPTGPLNNYWLNTWILQAVPHGMFFHGNDPGGHFGTEWWFVNFGKNGFLMNLVICWFLLHVFQAWKYMQNITDKSTPNQSHQKDTLSMAGFKSSMGLSYEYNYDGLASFFPKKNSTSKMFSTFPFCRMELYKKHLNSRWSISITKCGCVQWKSAHQAGWIFTTFQNVFSLRVCNPRLLFYSFGVIICQTVTDHCRYAATGADVPACEPDLLRCFGRKGHGCKPPTWRIIPIHKPSRPFGRGIILRGRLTNHGYKPFSN